MSRKEIDEIVATLISAREAYYNGSPFMTDPDFDELESKLQLTDPDNEYFDQVGYVLNEPVENTVQFNTPMLSIRKLKNNIPVETWYKSCRIDHKTTLVGEPKVDGISGSLKYIDGKLVYGSTRGNGKTGVIIDFVGKIDNESIPNNISTTGEVEVRGEFYIPKYIGDIFYKDKPLRNNCSGILKSGENTHHVRFIAYKLFEYDNPHNTEMEDLIRLSYLGFKTIQYSQINKPEDIRDTINNYIISLRDLFEYETDGYVFMVNEKVLQDRINNSKIVRSFNHHIIAIKPPTKVVKSPLLDIELNVSKSGRIIPVAIYEPVIIDNVEFERATLNNYEYLKSFGDLYVGNTVYITRANDVIPQIVKMDNDGNISLPIQINKDRCPSCGKLATLVGKHLVCRNPNCQGKIISQIYNWVEKRNMKNIGIKFLELAYKKGIIKNILDLYDPNLESKISKLERFIPGGGKVNKIIKAISKSKEDIQDIDILEAIGIPGIGRVVLENLHLTSINTLPADLMKSNQDLATYKYISEWLTIPGNFIMLKNLKKILGSKSFSLKDNGKYVAITGSFQMKRSEIEKMLKSKGYKILNNVTRDTTYLIVGDTGDSESTKLKKASDLGIAKVYDLSLL